MRTMSACSLTVSLKSAASVMSGGGPAGIVGQRTAKGNIAASLELGNPVDRGKFQLRTSENADEWLHTALQSRPWCVRVNRSANHLNKLLHASRRQGPALALDQSCFLQHLDKMGLQIGNTG